MITMTKVNSDFDKYLKKEQAKLAEAVAKGTATQDQIDRLAEIKDKSSFADYATESKPGELEIDTGEWFNPDGALTDIRDGSMVNMADFKKALDGFDPKTDQHVQIQGDKKRVAALDTVFSPPKDFSAVYALANPEMKVKLEGALLKAVKTSLTYVNDNVTSSRTGKGGLVDVKASIAATLNTHLTSRNGDPQIHIHASIINVARDEEGNFRALDTKPLFQNRSAMDAIFNAELIQELQKLNPELTVELPTKAFDIKEIPVELSDKWSSRTAEIQDQIAVVESKTELTPKGKKALQAAIGVVGRQTKEELAAKKEAAEAVGLAGKGTTEAWKAEADQVLGSAKVASIQALINGDTAIEVDVANVKNPDLKAISKVAIDEFLEHEAAMTEPQIIEKLALHVRGHGGMDEVKAMRSWLNDPENPNRLMPLHVNASGQRLYTTPEMFKIDGEIIDMSIELNETTGQELSQQSIDEALAKATGMSEEQKQAVKYSVDKGNIKLVIGSAGVGKSYSLGTVIDIYKANDMKVFGLAIGHAQKNALIDSTKGADGNTKLDQAGVITDFIKKYDETNAYGVDENTVIIVDECALVGSRDMNKLMTIAKETGAKLILTGDDLQLQSVAAGAATDMIRQQIGAATIETIRRQYSPEHRQMVADFRDGKARVALDNLDNLKGLVFADDRKAAIKAAVNETERFLFDPKNSGKTTLLIATNNTDVRELNDQVRLRLRDRNTLTGPDVTVKVSQFGGQGSSAGLSRELAMAVGDRLVLRKNDKALGVTNKDGGIITSIKQQDGKTLIGVKLYGGREIVIDSSKYKDKGHGGAMPVSLGYATTAHAAQGETVDHAVFLGTGADASATYVGMSRHKSEVTLIADSSMLKANIAQRHDYDKGSIDLSRNAQIDELARTMAVATRKVHTHEHVATSLITSKPQDGNTLKALGVEGPANPTPEELTTRIQSKVGWTNTQVTRMTEIGVKSAIQLKLEAFNRSVVKAIHAVVPPKVKLSTPAPAPVVALISEKAKAGFKLAVAKLKAAKAAVIEAAKPVNPFKGISTLSANLGKANTAGIEAAKVASVESEKLKANFAEINKTTISFFKNRDLAQLAMLPHTNMKDMGVMYVKDADGDDTRDVVAPEDIEVTYDNETEFNDNSATEIVIAQGTDLPEDPAEARAYAEQTVAAAKELMKQDQIDSNNTKRNAYKI